MTAQSRARIAAIFGIFIFMTVQCPVRAIAQATTGAEVANLAAVDSVVSKKPKNELLITDSLWGNLILDMAYQRDPQLRKIFKRFGLVNMGTMAAIAGIAGGTLAQGVIALATLNPAQGNDTYLPGAIGIGMSGLTIATFAGRAMINHHLAKCLRKRQLEIKHRVETVLAKLEQGEGQDNDSKKELVDLIGERATNEWLQLWRSANVIATMKQPNISIAPQEKSSQYNLPLHLTYPHAIANAQ